MNSFDKFYAYLEEVHQNHERLSALLMKKLEAAQRFDIVRLDEIIKEEQVFVLLSKSFDSHIQGFRKQLALTGKNLSEIIPQLPPGEQQRFHELFSNLKASVEQARILNEKCQELLEERLYSINKAVKAMDKSAGTSYGKASEAPAADGPKLFTKTI